MKIYPFFIPHAGCPHRCRFCQQNSLSGVSRAPAPEEVCVALEKILPDKGEGEAAFFGGTFTLLASERQKAYLDQVAPFIRSGRLSGIRVSTRPDAISRENAGLLKECGVTTVELGCQSFSPAVLSLVQRGHGPDAAAIAVPILREQGLKVGLQLMPGLPGGDRKEAVFSLRRALALNPDFLRIYPAVVLKGTELEQVWRKGDFQPLALETAIDVCADLLLDCLAVGIPVIRLGLQSTEELDRGDLLLAGPYHPAFGQLVQSRLWRRALDREMALMGAAAIQVHPADLGNAVGHRRENLHYLQGRYPGFSLGVQRTLPRYCFRFGERVLSAYPAPAK
ncbi:MAG: radical SAM protein [Syntrophotaleaceae bacterium]